MKMLQKIWNHLDSSMFEHRIGRAVSSIHLVAVLQFSTSGVITMLQWNIIDAAKILKDGSYMRETGEILSEMSFPITVEGKHWGGFAVGVNPELFTR